MNLLNNTTKNLKYMQLQHLEQNEIVNINEILSTTFLLHQEKISKITV